jgi:hypothetical protein
MKETQRKRTLRNEIWSQSKTTEIKKETRKKRGMEKEYVRRHLY